MSKVLFSTLSPGEKAQIGMIARQIISTLWLAQLLDDSTIYEMGCQVWVEIQQATLDALRNVDTVAVERIMKMGRDY